MIKKLVHLADIHIRCFKRHDEYREVLAQVIQDIKVKVSEFKREEVRIVIVGDLLHQKITVSNEQSVLVAWLLRELVSIAPVVLVAGNHDLLENNKERLDSITPIVDILGIPDIKYYKESKCYLDDNIVWCNYSIFEHSKRPDIEEAKREYINKTYIGLYHGALLGGQTDLGYIFDEGATLDLFRGLDMGLLGDLHKRSHYELKEEKEISENELKDYLALGWVLNE